MKHHRHAWRLLAALATAAWVPAVLGESTHLPDRNEYLARKAATAPVVDGVADESAWGAGQWYDIGERWLGPEYTAEDFQGRFKVVWTEERIYILVEFVDDILIDSHRDPLVQYWDDDCLEVFLDEDRSGGEHHYSHNAFTYHVSLDNRAIDIGTDEQAHDYTDHVDSRWRQFGDKIVWELAIDVYANDYVDGSGSNEPVSLSAGKILGLMLAYCDNDGSPLRENFIGSETVPTGPKDRGYIDAGLFGSLILVES